jgi:hypothetical protein
MTRTQTYITQVFLIVVIILTSIFLYNKIVREFGLASPDQREEPVHVIPDPQTRVVIVPGTSQDGPVSATPNIPRHVLGATPREVNALLGGWRSVPNEANPNWQNYFDDAHNDIKMTVMFSSSGRAIVVSVVNQHDQALSRERVQELLAIIGGSGVELAVHNNIGSFARVEVPDQEKLPEINGRIIGFNVGVAD